MENCIFCKIAAKEVPSTIVYETDDVICFRDLRPVAPTHVLIVPKKHFANLNEIAESEDAEQVMGAIARAASEVARLEGIREKGYRLINNCGKDGGQTVMHVHFHLIAGLSLSEKLI